MVEPPRKIYEFVSWDDGNSPYISGKKKNEKIDVPNYQPVIDIVMMYYHHPIPFPTYNLPSLQPLVQGQGQGRCCGVVRPASQTRWLGGKRWESHGKRWQEARGRSPISLDFMGLGIPIPLGMSHEIHFSSFFRN